jgi:Cyclic nucleotide-binding domain
VIGGDEVERAIRLFGDKYPAALGANTMNISFFRIVPSDVKLVDESYGGGRGETQLAGGAEYSVEQVYNVVGDLPASEVGAIVGRLGFSTVEAGEVIGRQGTPADKFVIVLEGEIEVTRAGDDGDQERVMTLGPGDFFGEVAILRDTPRSATLTALGEARVLTMERDDFTKVVGQALGAPPDFERILRERLAGGEAR